MKIKIKALAIGTILSLPGFSVATTTVETETFNSIPQGTPAITFDKFTPIPEPTTASLFGLGLLAIFIRR